MPVLRQGDRGIDVRKVQLLINAQTLPGHRLRPDGTFGSRTDAAVRFFQKLKNIECDGVVGRATWDALGVLPTVTLAVPDTYQPGDWMAIAAAELGVRGDTRPGQHTQRILEYHATTSLGARSDEIPWCSAFVNWVLKQAGCVGTNSAAAASWLKWGRELDSPRTGAITITKRRGADVANGSSSGFHVSFYKSSEGGPYFSMLGGNQRNSVRVSRYNLTSYEYVKYRWPT
jgi:uncharacterized protein (TIGR02594 family)